jgi:hypothetical protein
VIRFPDTESHFADSSTALSNVGRQILESTPSKFKGPVNNYLIRVLTKLLAKILTKLLTKLSIVVRCAQ